MPATETLSSTTLSQPVGRSDQLVQVASTTGLTPGIRLFIDGELMTVVSLDPNKFVRVLRGVDGTAAHQHSSAWPVWIGRADQFRDRDPVGTPPEAMLVSPWINVTNGAIWFAQGNASNPESGTLRYWQRQTNTVTTGALGVQIQTLSPTSST